MPALSAFQVGRAFDGFTALDSVDFAVQPGEIHGLLGANGAGKTTLLQILSGLIAPTSGRVELFGDVVPDEAAAHGLLGLVSSGEHTFDLRVSGLGNLVFSACRLGLGRKAALALASEKLEQVGLRDAASKPAGAYSRSMQRRLAVARALLADPRVLLVDEPTNGLDPDGSRRVRELVAGAAARGAAVVWATQLVGEIHDLAGRVTLLSEGRVRFAGTVPHLTSHAAPRRHILRLRGCLRPGTNLGVVARHALFGRGKLVPLGEGSERFLLTLSDGCTLGEALVALVDARIEVLSCRQERSELEEAVQLLAGLPE
jgi:ABC-type multidrug transport system ATPase subunit